MIRKVYVLTARGGQYNGSPYDTQTPYVRYILGLFGITDIEFVYAEGLNMGDVGARRGAGRGGRTNRKPGGLKLFRPAIRRYHRLGFRAVS